MPGTSFEPSYSLNPTYPGALPAVRPRTAFNCPTRVGCPPSWQSRLGCSFQDLQQFCAQIGRDGHPQLSAHGSFGQ